MEPLDPRLETEAPAYSQMNSINSGSTPANANSPSFGDRTAQNPMNIEVQHQQPQKVKAMGRTKLLTDQQAAKGVQVQQGVQVDPNTEQRKKRSDTRNGTDEYRERIQKLIAKQKAQEMQKAKDNQVKAYQQAQAQAQQRQQAAQMQALGMRPASAFEQRAQAVRQGGPMGRLQNYSGASSPSSGRSATAQRMFGGGGTPTSRRMFG